MYMFVLAIFMAGFLALIWRIIYSPFGQILKAIRENQDRAISLGYDTDMFKLMAFVISGAIAGTAGATKSLVFQLASLTDVHWSMSGEVVLMTLVGGMGTLFGPWWRRCDRQHAKLLGPIGCMGHHHSGRDLCGVRVGFPPRHHWRNCQLDQEALVMQR
jgi:hypothetical protein